MRVVALVCAVAGVLVVPAAAAAAPGGWVVQGAGLTTSYLHGVSCGSVAHCVAVGPGGTILATEDGVDWELQASGTSSDLYNVSCASVLHCVAVGDDPVVRVTADGGQTWTGYSTGAVTGSYYVGVDCLSAQACIAVGGDGLVRATLDGGQTWTGQNANTTGILYDVSCSSAATCMLTGDAGIVRRTETGGKTVTGSTGWETVIAGTSDLLRGISCPSANECWTVGYPSPSGTNHPGTTRATLTGGAIWSIKDSLASAFVHDVSCPTTSVCRTVGQAGTIRSTTTAGTTWATEPSTTTSDLLSIDCPTPTDCWAVGFNGTIVSNTSGAAQPIGDAVQTVTDTIIRPPFGAPSDDCDTPAATVVDGYFGSLYARLKTQDSGTGTWVCARLQPEGGQEIAGGKLVVGSGSPVTMDSNYGACSTQSDNVLPSPHGTSGHLGDSSDPATYVPYMFDAYANDSGAAWVCLQAGLGRRVLIGDPSGAGLFQQDDKLVAVSPPRMPWPIGNASSDCDTQTTGTHDRLVNAMIAGTQVWLDRWTSGSKVELCVRAEGPTSAGGRLTVDATGSPGVTPVYQLASNTTGCTLDVATNDTAALYVRRSATGANPASVCVTLGGTTERFTIGYSGTADPPAVTWTADS